jgi:maltose alpha-D-glucosyltransferase/alpha-amylase
MRDNEKAPCRGVQRSSQADPARGGKQSPEGMQVFLGKVNECPMAFYIPPTLRVDISIAQEDRFPITDILRQTRDIPPSGQGAIFLCNHDERMFEMVTAKERDYL